MKVIQVLFFPLSILYQVVLRLRNYFYDSGIFGITEFEIPIINVGNLAFGGTGKTPHIEYLIRLLKPKHKIAVLSRGYKRKTRGYVFGDSEATVFTMGDEPFQILKKFPEIDVAVCENRVLGIPNLLFDAQETEVILLDDAFQHRAIKPGLNILLTEQRRLYTDDFLFPSGYLREYSAAAKRADIIIVSKCDPKLTLEERIKIKNRLNPLPHQKVYFSFIHYAELVPYFEYPIKVEPAAVLAFAGIANTSDFNNYLKGRYKEVVLKSLPDHHQFSETGFQKLLESFGHISQNNKILISTEKDYQKLVQSPFAEMLKEFPLFYLPVEVAFFSEDKDLFEQNIFDYVQQNRTNS